MAQNVTTDDFEDVVLKSDKPVVVDFWAAWCGPCIALGPTIEQLAEEEKDRVTVVKLNVDENRELATKYGIMSIPNVKIFKDGEVVKDLVGLLPKPAYKQAIDTIL
jgi:thioredoxin 1